MTKAQRITDEQRDGSRVLIWANGEWWPAEWYAVGNCGPGWYPGVYDLDDDYLGFPDSEVDWWLPMPPSPI
jgi:hypothetical protein